MKIQIYILRALVLKGISVYQKAFSPLLPPSCRFYPSCSEYATQCLEKYGLRRGMPRAVRRVLRCHPGHEGGFDPVD